MSHYSGRRCRPCSCCISCCNLFFCCLTLQSSKNNIAPHGSRCAGTSFALGVFRGFSAVCPISHFNVSVRRFNVWGYLLYRRRPACPVAVVYVPMAWRCPLLRGFPLARCAASLPPSLFPCVLVGGCPLLRRGGLGGLRRLLRRSWLSAKVSGKVAKVAGIVAPLCAKVAGKVAMKVASACPKVAHLPQNHSRLQNSVYKGGIFLAHFPGINGKSCKSRSVSAHFTSKSLASMYFCWSCSGVKPSICGWFGVKTISCLSTMP